MKSEEYVISYQWMTLSFAIQHKILDFRLSLFISNPLGGATYIILCSSEWVS